MRQYRLLEINSQYDLYLSRFYRTHNNDIDSLSYDELYQLLMDNFFAEADFIHRQLGRLGIESKIVFHNNRTLQNKWKQEHKAESCFDILLQQIKEYAPDIILNSAPSEFTKEETVLIREAMPSENAKLVGFHFTLLNDAFKEVVSLYDQIYTGGSVFVRMMREQGIPAYLLRHAFEPTILERLPRVERKNELCFPGSIMVGNNMHNNRLDMLCALKSAGVPCAYYGDIYYNEQEDGEYSEMIKELAKGKNPGVFGLEYYAVLNQYSVCMNAHGGGFLYKESVGNVRMYEATGMGCCLLTDDREENSELFEVGREIMVYESMEDMQQKARWLLDNPDKAKEIALAGQKKTLAEYTYRNKAWRLNEYIQELLK